MLIYRPVRATDMDAVHRLAETAGFGLTSLPANPELLDRRLTRSVKDFEYEAKKPGDRIYLFVLEDTEAGRIAGISGIFSKLGGYEPNYLYELRTRIRESKDLGIRKEILMLHLVKEHDGPSSIGSLFLDPDYRMGGNGRFLSLIRFIYMALYPNQFEKSVVAEMRGRINEKGESPFWEALGRKFFAIDFPKADYLSFLNKKFIADLMPEFPIYVDLLPEAAREAIGHVHANTEPALAILKKEGFRYENLVDIFEAGPVVRAEVENIRVVRDMKKTPLAGMEPVPDTPAYIVASRMNYFRGVKTGLRETPEGVVISEEAARGLEVAKGDEIAYAPLFI